MNRNKISLVIDPDQPRKWGANISPSLCALINDGGTLELRTKQEARNALKRLVEQKIQRLMGPCKLSKKVKYNEDKDANLFFHFDKADSLCTVKYNLYLPSETQFLSLPPTEEINEVKEILNFEIVAKETTKAIGDHHKTFVQNEKVKLPESRSTQLKNIKSEPTKNVTIHERISCKCNKITNTVSGFANLNGGHIYYGIADDGKVEGEVVDENEERNNIKCQAYHGGHDLACTKWT